MKYRRYRSAKNKEVDEGSDSSDFINTLTDDILVMILCHLPMKYAVVTSSVCTRWRFLWRNLIKLNFDGTEDLSKTEKNRRGFYTRRNRFLDQVNGVISSYNHQIVKEFRICFNLNEDFQTHIDGWLRFAVKKKVEMIELNFADNDGHRYFGSAHNYESNYEFPLRLSHRGHLFKWPTSNATVVEIPSLKQLLLKNVNVTEEILEQFLTNSPNLEKISIRGSRCLIHIRISGRELNLKHFEIHECPSVKSIHLSDFDLVSFEHKGEPIDLNLANLPRLRKLICQGLVGLEDNLLKQISSSASSLQELSFFEYYPRRFLNLDFLPMLQNLKKLMLIIGAHADQSLLCLTSIVKACPSLEILTVKLIWFSPVRKRKEVMHVTSNRHDHLKHFQILGYNGRVSDLELVVYMIENAVALQKIVIDPRYQMWHKLLAPNNYLKEEKRARSSAKRQLIPRSPPGVNLVIL